MSSPAALPPNSNDVTNEHVSVSGQSILSDGSERKTKSKRGGAHVSYVEEAEDDILAPITR